MVRYNYLLLGVIRQLADLKKAVKGLVVVTPELEEISHALLQGKVRYGCQGGNPGGIARRLRHLTRTTPECLSHRRGLSRMFVVRKWFGACVRNTSNGVRLPFNIYRCRKCGRSVIRLSSRWVLGCVISSRGWITSEAGPRRACQRFFGYRV